MIRIPNRTGQTGTYQTGSPNYVDVSSGAAQAGMQTFATRATSSSWEDGDTISISVVKDNDNYWVGVGTWDSSNSYIELTTEEEAVGTLLNGVSVTIVAVVTEAALMELQGREVLTADRTYYVATDGNDSNDGLSSGSSFLTVQKAVDVVCSIDCSIYQVTIQVADGTYSAGAELGATVGQKMVILQGNVTTPSNVVINATDHCFRNSAPVSWQIQGFKLQVTGSYFCLTANTPASTIWFDKIDFGVTGHTHIVSTDGGLIRARAGATYTISGSPTYDHVLAARGGLVAVFTDVTVTLTGTPSFSTFITASSLASVRYNPTIVGSATGIRYGVSQNAVLDVSGNGSTYLPGSSSGVLSEGGIYT